MALSESQKISLALVPKVSSFLSIIGSTWIVLEVVGDKDKQKQMYHRLMAIFALVDVIVSISFFLSTWPMHENDHDVVWSHGNNTTCHLQGFFIQIGSATFIYYAVLTAYFGLVIRFGVKDEVLAKYEFLFHLIPIGFGLATATTAVSKGWFDNATIWCWLAGFDQENVYRWAFYYAPLFFSLFFVTVNMFAIYRGVYMKEKESLKYQFETRKHLVSPYMYQNTRNRIATRQDITTSTERSAALGHDSSRFNREQSPESFSDSRQSEPSTDLEVPTNTPTMTTTSTPHFQFIQDTYTRLTPVGECSGPELSSSELGPDPVDPSDTAAPMDEHAHKQTKFMQSMARLNSLRRNAAKSKRRLRRTRQVANQATLYIVAFYLTFLPVVLDGIYQQVHGSPLYSLLLLHVMLTPLQGMFNLVIYRRQYMVQLRKDNPNWSWFEVLLKSLDNSSLQRLRESWSSTQNQLGPSAAANIVGR